MRILVEPSDYRLCNRGDVASLYVALNRLRDLWPDAIIEVLSDDGDALQLLEPTITIQPMAGHRRWNGPLVAAGTMPPRRSRRPQWVATYLRGETRVRWPEVAARWHRRSPGRRSARSTEVAQYLAAVVSADLVVVTGMGGITDDFGDYAVGLLGTIALAARHGVPVAMMSQQIGPLARRQVERVARRVLPEVDLIALREGAGSLSVLRRLGVDPRRVRVTGDDTVAYVHGLPGGALGTGLGLNVRKARYAGIALEQAEDVGQIVQATSQRLGAPLVGLPVSHCAEADRDTIDAVTGGAATTIEVAVTDVAGFVRVVQGCRVVVTGSYHGAVFALAQGIPAICLTNSPYYDQKFLGLAELFGDGCEVVSIDASLSSTLPMVIERMWADAPGLQPSLGEAAARQVEMGRAAYAELAHLVGP